MRARGLVYRVASRTIDTSFRDRGGGGHPDKCRGQRSAKVHACVCYAAEDVIIIWTGISNSPTSPAACIELIGADNHSWCGEIARITLCGGPRVSAPVCLEAATWAVAPGSAPLVCSRPRWPSVPTVWWAFQVLGVGYDRRSKPLLRQPERPALQLVARLV